MSRYPLAQFEEGSTAAEVSADVAVLGWADGVDPSLLPGGESALLSRAVNLRMEDGQPSTRLGMITPGAMNPAGIGAVCGMGRFNDPSASGDWLLVACDTGIWRVGDEANPIELSRTSGWSIGTGPVKLVQAFNRVLGFRGVGVESIVWDGSVGGRWMRQSELADPGDYTRPLPGAPWGVVMAGRVWVPSGKDLMIPSLLDEPTRYDPDPRNFQRLNAGHADEIVTAVPFNDSRMLVLKSASLHSIDNVTGSLASVTVRHHSGGAHGCVAAESAVMVGDRCFWLGAGSVLSVSVSTQGRLSVDDVPLSQAIRGTMERVNWAAAKHACAVADARYYYLAVPIDGSAVNNALLVYDHTVQQWVSLDTFGWRITDAGALETQTGAVSIAGLALTRYCGREAVVMTDGLRVRVLHQDRGADSAGDVLPIRTVARYRGTGGPVPRIKRVRATAFALQVWNCTVQVGVQTEGARVRPLKSVASDRSAWRYYGKHPRPLDNRNDDAAADDRRDYVVPVTDEAMIKSGIPLNRLAYVLDGAGIDVRGRWSAVEFSSSGGHMVVSAVQTEHFAERSKHHRH